MSALTGGSREQITNLLRCLYRELRSSVPEGKHVYQTQSWKYIRDMMEDKGQNRSPEDLKNLEEFGHTYLSYLRSTRRTIDIITKYKGKGELSIREAATVVGFALPDELKAQLDPSTAKDQGQEDPHGDVNPKS